MLEAWVVQGIIKTSSCQCPCNASPHSRRCRVNHAAHHRAWLRSMHLAAAACTTPLLRLAFVGGLRRLAAGCGGRQRCGSAAHRLHLLQYPQGKLANNHEQAIDSLSSRSLYPNAPDSVLPPGSCPPSRFRSCPTSGAPPRCGRSCCMPSRAGRASSCRDADLLRPTWGQRMQDL